MKISPVNYNYSGLNIKKSTNFTGNNTENKVVTCKDIDYSDVFEKIKNYEGEDDSEITFCMMKPGELEHGESLKGILEDNGYCILHDDGKWGIWLDEGTAKKHYDNMNDKPFFNGLVDYISNGGPVRRMVVAGPYAVGVVNHEIKPIMRSLSENPNNKHATKNVFHSSDSPKNAESEIKLHFLNDITKQKLDDENEI